MLLFCFMGAGVHTFAALKVSDRQLVVKRDRQGDFSHPPWSVFGQLFVIFSFVHGLDVFVKIEPPPRREFNFESPEPSKCHFFSPGTPSKN